MVLTPDRVAGETRPVRRSVRSPDAILIAVLAVVISAAAAGHPSLWFDEAATISASCHGGAPQHDAWIVVSTIITLVYSAVDKPVYYPRYLICTAPAMAIVLAICITMIVSTTWGVVGLMVLFAVATAPYYLVTQRGWHAKEGWDYSQVADVGRTHRGLGGGRSAQPMHHDLDDHQPRPHVAAPSGRCCVAAGAGIRPTPDGQILSRLGFHTVERWQFTFAQVIKSTR